MLATHTAKGSGFAISAEYPASAWYVAPSVVPALHSPHELGSISNRPLQQVPASSEENRPAVDLLDAAAVYVWIYYEVLGDPSIGDASRPPIPDYSGFSYPFEYNESQVFPAHAAYDWDPAVLTWRRLGRNLPPNVQRAQPAALTVMVWEGTRASVEDVRAAEAIVKSVSVAGS